MTPGELLLIVPEDLQPVGSPGRTAMVTSIASDLARVVPGRTLVLLPSVSALVEARTAVPNRRPVAWYEGMLPCEGERAGFDSDPRGFMLARQLWLGSNPIDALDLRCLVLERLPMDAQPENESGEQAGQVERADFLGAVLPQAVETVRLMAEALVGTYPPRACVLAIMDERVLTRPWGRLFLHGLPGVALGRSIEDVVSYYCRVRAAQRG